MSGQQDQSLGTPTVKFIENRTKVEITVNVKVVSSTSNLGFNWFVNAGNGNVKLAHVGLDGNGNIKTTPESALSDQGYISNIPKKLDSSTTEYKSILTFTIMELRRQTLEFNVVDNDVTKIVAVYTGPPFDTLTAKFSEDFNEVEVTVNVTPSTSTYEFNWTILGENQNQEVKLATVKLDETGSVTTSLTTNSYDGQYEIRNEVRTLDPFHTPFKSILTFPVSNQTLKFQVDDDSEKKKSVKVTRPDDGPDDDTVNPALPVVVMAVPVGVLGAVAAVYRNRISQLGLLILGVGFVLIGLGLRFGLPGNTGALAGGIIFAGFGVVFYVIALFLLCGVSKCGNNQSGNLELAERRHLADQKAQ